MEFLSADGDESYTVCYDREAISKSKSGDLLYLTLLDDNAASGTSPEDTTRGMTVYDGGDILVVSRGTTFEERLAEWQAAK